MSEEKQEPTNLQERLTKAQLEKLELEIDNLKREGKWERRLAKFTPMMSIILAVAGFGFGIYQFQKQQAKLIGEQEKERQTREQEQRLTIQGKISADVEQLLKFPTEQSLTTSKVQFLLEDLKQLLRISKEGNLSIPDNERKITFSLFYLVQEDCDFKQRRDVKFANTIFYYWEDSKAYLKENPKQLAYILDKYLETLFYFGELAPAYFRELKTDVPSEGVTVFVKNTEAIDASKVDSSKWLLFEDTVNGFGNLVKLVDNNSSRDYFLKHFQASICNPNLTQYYFNVKYPEDDPRIADYCSRTPPNNSFNRTRN